MNLGGDSDIVLVKKENKLIGYCSPNDLIEQTEVTEMSNNDESYS